MTDFDFDTIAGGRADQPSTTGASPTDALNPEPAPRSLVAIADNLTPILDVLRHTLADAPTFQLRLEEITPAERAEIVRMRNLLVDIDRPIRARLEALDQHVRRVYADRHADQLPVAGSGPIIIEPPANAYEVKAHELRRALLDLVDAGLVTKEEVDQAVTEQVSYVVNHRKLNYLARHRGDEVAAIIDEFRTLSTPDPYRARVRWPE